MKLTFSIYFCVYEKCINMLHSKLMFHEEPYTNIENIPTISRPRRIPYKKYSRIIGNLHLQKHLIYYASRYNKSG